MMAMGHDARPTRSFDARDNPARGMFGTARLRLVVLLVLNVVFYGIYEHTQWIATVDGPPTPLSLVPVPAVVWYTVG